MQMIGVGIAIIQSGKILLTKRQDSPVWCIPGGHLMPEESVLDAAVREAKEETGLDVEVTGFAGLYSLPDKWQDGSCEVILRGVPKGGKLLTDTDETVDSDYFSREELPDNLIGWQFHQIDDAFGGRNGGLSILDARLSIGQNRENVIQLIENEQTSLDEWLEELCAKPNRIDLN